MNPVESFRVREIWPAGTVIKGDYAIQTKIGSGGFGTVYLAQHRFLGTMHVIKRLHEQFASDPEYVRKFVNEARAVRRLKDCPNVVEVEHMTQSEDGHLILVMEHITGGDLGGLMDARPLRVDEVVEFARQIATGLQAAHASGLVHRDIKPQNVMVSLNSTGKLVLKLIDFGIAADHLSQQQTSVMRGGSIGYAAPEQWVKAGKEIDGRADLYSLGASMYRMLCGRMPYDTTDFGDWLERVRQGPPEAPMQLRAGIPRDLSDLILEMLAYSPDGRPADASVLIQRLVALQDGTTLWKAPVERVVTVEKTLLRSTPTVPWMKWALGLGIPGALAVMLVGGRLMIEKKELAPVIAVKPDSLPAPTIVTPPKSEPVKDHAALGDAAVKAGDYTTALTHFKALGDSKRLSALERSVEGDAEDRCLAFLDRGEYAEALRVVDRRSGEYPGSKRLQALRAKIVRARDAQ